MTIPVWELYIIPTVSSGLPVITVNPMAPTIPDSTPLGGVVAMYVVTMSDGSNFVGTTGFGPPNFDAGGIFALSGTPQSGNIIVSTTGPGVPAVPPGSSIQELISLTATQP